MRKAHYASLVTPSDDLLRYVEIVDPKHYRRDGNGTVRRTFPKLRGKAAVKRAKRERQRIARLHVQKAKVA